MKKLLLIFLTISTGLNLCAAAARRRPVMAPQAAPAGVYTPAQGPLHLNGTINAANAASRGVIIDNLITAPELQNEQQIVANFIANNGLNPAITYQQMMFHLTGSTNQTEALEVIQAFEKTIMHIYNYRTYYYHFYNPWLCMFVTGIKNSWLNPINYFKALNWYDDSSPEQDQLLEELNQIANIAAIHDPVITAPRIKLTVHSYRYWKRNLALTITAYLLANAYASKDGKSSLNALSHGLNAQTYSILKKNLHSDLKYAIANGPSLAKSVLKTGYSWAHWASYPIREIACHGVNAFDTQAQQKYLNNQKPEQTPYQTTMTWFTKNWQNVAIGTACLGGTYGVFKAGKTTRNFFKRNPKAETPAASQKSNTTSKKPA